MDARRAGLALALIAALAPGACASGGTTPAEGPAPSTTQDYLSGRAADVYLPTGVAAARVVVLVPGGAWLTADRTGLAPLAQHLAAAGMVAVNTTHRAVDAGARFPEPVADVLCAVGFAVQRAGHAGIAPGEVVVVGHSSGGHLAALAALGGDHFRAACLYPPAAIDALVGLAGAYDVRALRDLAEPLFGTGPELDPAAWRDGDPLAWARTGARSTSVRVLLAHGTADADLPVSMTTGFADALTAGGYEATVATVPGADHHSIYSAQVIGPRLVEWLDAG